MSPAQFRERKRETYRCESSSVQREKGLSVYSHVNTVLAYTRIDTCTYT